MGYVLRRVEVYAKQGDNWSPNATVLNEAFGVQVVQGWGKVKDSFSFSLPQSAAYFSNSGQPLGFDSLVRIFMWRDTPNYNPQTDIIIEGVIKGTPQTINDSGTIVTVEGFNFSEVFFNNQIPLNQTNKTWVEIFKQMLAFLNGNGVNSQTNRRVFWHPSNPTAKNDTSAFPQKTFITNFMTASTIAERITKDEFTGDGEYVWYVQQYKAKLTASILSTDTTIALSPIATPADITSELPDSGHGYIGTEKVSWNGRTGSTLTGVVRHVDGTTAAAHTLGDTMLISGQYHLVTSYKGSTTVLTVNEAGANDYEQGTGIKVDKDRDDIRNYVIYNCGTDLYGVAVESFYYDPTSAQLVGFKQYYATQETQDIFPNIWNKERFRKPASFTPDSDNTPTASFPTSYPYVFEDGTSVGTNKAFNDYLRTMALTQGGIVAKSLVSQSLRARYTVSYTARFTNQFAIGSLVQANFPSRSLNRPLRVLEIHHVFPTTTVMLDEDIRTTTVN